jgi:hypothetical protein
MRLLLFVVGISVGIVAIGNRAEGQNYPWCGVYRDGVTTVSEAGFCIQNSTYQTSLAL